MLELNGRQTLIVAILVLFLGKYLTQKVGFLNKYNIPEPVTGGVIFCVLSLLIYLVSDLSINFTLVWRDILLIAFFTCIGLNAKIADLLKGGKSLVVLLGLTAGYLVIQNIIGTGVASITGLSREIGLMTGSISLSGGHGTAIAWGNTFVNEYNVQNAIEIGAASATFGLVMGGVIGGPIANWLINKYKIETSGDEALEVGVQDENKPSITAYSVFNTLLVVSVAMGLGIRLEEYLISVGVKLPQFVVTLFCGIILTNTIPYLFKKIVWPSRTPTLALVSDICLGLFLSMSLMSLQLWTLAELAGPMLITLVVQLLSVILFSVFVIFRLMGKDYDAAVTTSGFIGITLGATPTAIVNMSSVTKKFGASPISFIIIPLVGAFFLDIVNAIIIEFFLSL